MARDSTSPKDDDSRLTDDQDFSGDNKQESGSARKRTTVYMHSRVESVHVLYSAFRTYHISGRNSHNALLMCYVTVV